MFAWGSINQITYLCAAVKRKVIVFELNNTKHRYKKLKVRFSGSLRLAFIGHFAQELALQREVQWIGVNGDRACVGYQSGFSLFSILGEGQPQSNYFKNGRVGNKELIWGVGRLGLIHADDLSLGFVGLNPLNSLCCIELDQRGTKEYLLCFDSNFIKPEI